MNMADLATLWKHRCAYCDKLLDDAAIQNHFIPADKGGSQTDRNLVYACNACAQEKGSIDPRRLLWVWLRLDPQGLVAALLDAMEAASPPPAVRLIVDNTLEAKQI